MNWCCQVWGNIFLQSVPFVCWLNFFLNFFWFFTVLEPFSLFFILLVLSPAATRFEKYGVLPENAYCNRLDTYLKVEISNIQRTSSIWVQIHQLRLLAICELWSIQNVFRVIIGRWKFVRRILEALKMAIFTENWSFWALFCQKSANMLKIIQKSRFSKLPRFCVRTFIFQLLRGTRFGCFKVHKSPIISIGGSEPKSN